MSPTNKIFHEIVPDRYQKMRFDIDSKCDELKSALGNSMSTLQLVKLFSDSVYNALKTVLEEYIQLSRSKLMIFTSNDETGINNKFSMHIVLSSYSFGGSRACKEVFKRCMKHIPSKLVQFFDKGVYGRNQGFRILGSTKMSSFRPKTLYPLQGYYQPVIGEMSIRKVFIDSLLSMVDDNVYIYIPLPEYQQTLSSVTREEALRCMGLLTQAGIYCYNLAGVTGGYILLQRKSPSMCRVCSRRHTSENAFCIKCMDGFTFHCRRNMSQKIFLGVSHEYMNRTEQHLDSQEVIKWAKSKQSRETFKSPVSPGPPPSLMRFASLMPPVSPGPPPSLNPIGHSVSLEPHSSFKSRQVLSSAQYAPPKFLN